jgi:hypothetical protein
MQRNVTNLEFDPTKVHPTDATKQVIANMLLLGATDMLIGKFTSNVFRIAFQLMVAQSPAGHMKPFISLDSPWCSDYFLHSGVGQDGIRFAC